MNETLVQRIADAVLYEGYILYPYRPALKNRQRWTFGALYPQEHCRHSGGIDAWTNQTECLFEGGADTRLHVRIRFLHLTARWVGELAAPQTDWPADVEPSFRRVETLRIGDKQYHSWQEAEERDVDCGALDLGTLLARPRHQTFAFPEQRWLEPLRDDAGVVVGLLEREKHAIAGIVEVAAARVAATLYRVTVRVLNRTPLDNEPALTRDDALLRALVSTHAVLGVAHGKFVSLLDPSPEHGAAAAACCNIGIWPVLVGEAGQRATMLSAPIILYDYPQVAAESPGDFFDGTEIDEMLTLRILTLTDDEKRAMALVDERASALLARTVANAEAQLRRLHGAVRTPRPIALEQEHEQ
jgi:hypothetical protein